MGSKNDQEGESLTPEEWSSEDRLLEKEAIRDLLQTQHKENLLGARTRLHINHLSKGFCKRVYSGNIKRS